MRRREFLRRVSAGVTSMLAAPSILPAAASGPGGTPGPNERVRVGIIGAGGRMGHLIGEDSPRELEPVAMADCDLAQMDRFVDNLARKHPDKFPGAAAWPRYRDYRQLLDREKLDAVVVATTTHARAVICVHAMQAGLDVYAEKPLTLTIEEGRHLVKAEKKYGSVFQVGTQQRSIPINNFGSDLVRGGAIGKIETVLCVNFIGPERRPPTPGEPAPRSLDWDAWCHQTELVPYSKDLHPGLWRWGRWRAYDGGGLSYGVTGWGTHAFDQVQRALGTDDTGPVEIWPDEPGPGGKVSMRYASGTVVKLELPCEEGQPGLGAIFVGENGKIEINRNHVVTDPPELAKDAPPPDDRSVVASVSYRHLKNWIDCMRSRERPNAGAEIGHRATVLCHLVNICRELGRKLTWDPVAEEFVGDDEANALRSRPRRKGYGLPDLI